MTKIMLLCKIPCRVEIPKLDPSVAITTLDNYLKQAGLSQDSVWAETIRLQTQMESDFVHIHMKQTEFFNRQ